MTAARRLIAISCLVALLGSTACVRGGPELRIATAEAVESEDLESGSTLVLRGDGFPVGMPAEATFVGERRSFVDPGSVTISLPARAVARDRVEIALDTATTAELLGEGDDDARLEGTITLRFATSAALVTTAPVGAKLRVRAYPRHARIAADKRARVRDALGSVGIELGDGLAVVGVKPSLLRRGDVQVGDRLTALDGVPLAADDDAIPPKPFGTARIEAVSADGSMHHASGLLGVAWLLRAAALAALVAALTATARRALPRLASRGVALVPAQVNAAAPGLGDLAIAVSCAGSFELGARLLRARVDVPIVLVLLAIAAFGPARRSVLLALALGLAASAAIVSGGVFRVDELSGALGAASLPGLLLVLAVWAQRFAGRAPTRAARLALLFVTIPLLHVIAPRVGSIPALGRALAATVLATTGAPLLQRALAPLPAGLGPLGVVLSLVGALGALAVGLAVGPLAGALVAGASTLTLVVAAVLRAPAIAAER